MSDSDIPRCPWCKSAGHHEGTTTKYDCLSSLGCAHQKQSAACKLLQAAAAREAELRAEVERLRGELAYAISLYRSPQPKLLWGWNETRGCMGYWFESRWIAGSLEEAISILAQEAAEAAKEKGEQK